ncbi:unnamed protein product [Rotaria sp. Silwood1]|nr:unnamed protein product [Rotaria sp. Silwood1]CAF5022030.1 unnamed protein product [Rotaria sp. Silwood1]
MVFLSSIAWCSIRDYFLVLSCMTRVLFDTDLDINTTIKKIHGTQSNHLISLTYIVQDKKFNKNSVKRKLSNKDYADIQYVRINLSGSQLGLVIKNKNDQVRFVLYPMNLTHICCNSNYSFIITIKRKSKY